MKVLATFLREAEGFVGDARLYGLSAPIPYGWDEDENKTTDYVIVSGTFAMEMEETYIFASNEEGLVLDWCEMSGSFRGSIDHKQALENADIELV